MPRTESCISCTNRTNQTLGTRGAASEELKLRGRRRKTGEGKKNERLCVEQKRRKRGSPNRLQRPRAYPKENWNASAVMA